MSNLTEYSMLVEIRYRLDGFLSRLDKLESTMNTQLEILNKLDSMGYINRDIAVNNKAVKTVSKSKVSKEKQKES